jgi:hypothetical protein
VFWRAVEILVGLFSIGVGLFSKEFTPIGWTTMLIWGRGENGGLRDHSILDSERYCSMPGSHVSSGWSQ